MKNFSLIPILLIGSLLFLSCEKQYEWLDIKNNKNLVVPETLQDFQAILDNSNIMNRYFSTPGLVGADNVYVTDNNYPTLQETERNLYIWAYEIWADGTSAPWTNLYSIVGYANLVLDGLKKIDESGAQYANLEGQAYFYRAYAFYILAQLFCKPYDDNTANSLGLPLRLTADINVIEERASLAQTYEQILADAQASATLLSTEQTYLLRPSKAAAFGLLAKTYLLMGNYREALRYADEALQLHPALLNFNSDLVQPNTTYRFPTLGVNNPEIMFYAEAISYQSIRPVTSSTGNVDTLLYGQYAPDDLRKSTFYMTIANAQKFMGAYTGSFANFTGIASNEIYLIRAECYARLDRLEEGLNDLNLLLLNRYKNGMLVPFQIDNKEVLLTTILNERRKELPFTANLRWEDLRRLNKEPLYRQTIRRRVNGVEYVLEPNSARFVLPVPNQEIELSGISQNER